LTVFEVEVEVEVLRRHSQLTVKKEERSSAQASVKGNISLGDLFTNSTKTNQIIFNFKPKFLPTNMHVLDAKQHRWENGAALDSPVREAKLKALFLKEQATWETIVKALPLPDSSKQTADGQDQNKSSPVLSLSFGTSLNARMSYCLPMDSKLTPPKRWREGAQAA
jgi:hypothetical protein